MMKKKARGHSSIGGCMLFLLLFFVVIPSALSSSFGASPGRLEIKDALRGSVIERTFTFSSSTINDPIMYTLAYSGEISGWITAKNGDKIIIGPETHRTEKTFVFTVPKEVPNGIYTGRIFASYAGSGSGKESGSTSSVSAGVVILVTIHVTGDQKKEFTVLKSSIPDTEEGAEAQLVLDTRNDGNVDAVPDKVVVEVKERFAGTTLKKIEITKFQTSVPPFSRGEIISSFSPELPPDTYWAGVSVYSGRKLVKKDNVPFKILPKGTLLRDIKFLKLSVPSEAETGMPVKITLSMRNAGEATSNCIAKAEIHKADRDDILLAALESEPVLVFPESFKDINIYYAPSFSGEHIVDAFLRCDGADTESRTASFSVSNQYAQLATPAVAVVILLFLMLLVTLKKRLKEDFQQ